jgi:RimJ/RimL family protein N-acetyltransferase
MNIALHKASASNSEQIHKMQIAAFLPMLQKYQDNETCPAAETFEQVQKRFDNPLITYFFILKATEKIGVIRIGKIDEAHYKLSQILILPEFQEKGYGQKAIKLLEALFPNVKKWELGTIKQELKLCHFYEKMGYNRTKEKQIKDGMTMVYYEKQVF